MSITADQLRAQNAKHYSLLADGFIAEIEKSLQNYYDRGPIAARAVTRQAANPDIYRSKERIIKHFESKGFKVEFYDDHHDSTMCIVSW